MPGRTIPVGRGKQLIGDVRPPLPVRPGTAARHDSEYVRGGVANLFMALEPLVGWRHVEVTERKTSVDFARLLQTLSDEHYRQAERVVLVCDNLSTHTARRLVRSIRAGRSAAAGRAVRMALHAQARLVARRGRDRTERAGTPVPGPSHPRRVHAAA